MRTFVWQNIHYFVILQHVTNALSAFYIKSYNSRITNDTKTIIQFIT